jgi:hypothetical protein
METFIWKNIQIAQILMRELIRMDFLVIEAQLPFTLLDMIPNWFHEVSSTHFQTLYFLHEVPEISVKVHTVIFSILKLCNLIGCYQHFGGTYCIHLQCIFTCLMNVCEV